LIPLTAFGKKKDKGEALSDSTQITISNIFIGGNKKTKEKIIIRELLFKKGDTIYQEYLETLIEKSKENLLNTSLFNYITINTLEEDENKIGIYILVEERWYLWPYLIFEQADRNLSAFLYNQDWSRINYGMLLIKNNFRGRGETVKLKFRLGYKEQFQIGYEVPYIGKSRQHGLSTEFNWFRQHEVAYNTQNDKLIYYKDYNNYVSKMHNSRLTYQYRNKHYLRHNLSVSYSFNDVHDTIIELNKNYLGTQSSQTQYIGLHYNLSIDKRNYKHYPLKGYNVEITFSQNGLNLLPNEMKGIWEIESQGYKYWEIIDRWYTGVGTFGKISSNTKQPFFIEEALGYKNFLRSFEYNVIDGQNLITGRTFIKYAIIPLQVRHFEGWNWTKFNKIHYSLFLNTFIDAGYVYDIMPALTNELPNTFLASAGIGIDLVAYYDQIIRLEYSMNRFGGSGLFIHIGKAF
jgi:outer membrane protein assembly factor BamA